MSKTLKFALSLMLIVLLALPMMTAQASDNTVNPFSTDWALVVETAGTNSATFVEGPATAPAGYGSLRMTIDGSAGIAYATQKYQGTRLADIESLAYSTYVTSGSGATAIAFQINYDPDLSDTTDPKPWYGRLVYEPYRNGTVATGAWQTWDMLDGGAAVWWASPSANSPVDDVCGQNTPCTLEYILETWPNIGIRDDGLSAIQFKAGGSWAGGFDGNVDLLIIEIGGVTDTYDFEPYLPVHNITQDTKHATIQAGINAATAGDVLEINPGTYVENVVVNKSITLRGAGDGDNPAEDTILDGTSLTGIGIRLNNNITDVTIEDMRIVNYTGTSTSSGIYGNQSNHNLTIQNVTVNSNGPGSVSASGGIMLNGPIDNVLIDNVTAHNNWGRGIVIWNGFKTNITITNNDVRNNVCCGIELQDGTASGVTMTGNTVIGNADSGMSATGLTSGAGPNLIANNIVTDNGRFGIEVKLPNGTGTTSGDGSIVVENNTVSLTTPKPTDLRDYAGIAVFRRGWLASEGNADIPTGVIVRNNTVSGYQQTNGGSFSDGFGIVVEGLNMQVLNNTLEDNDVGVQVQAGHTPYNPNAAGDGDQGNLDDDYFGRGNSPIACALVDSNTYTDNDVDYRVVGADASDSASIHNETAGTYQCTIQQAIDLASDGDTISVPAGTYTENVTINKAVALRGANFNINPNTETRGPESILSGTWSLRSSGITIDGFQVTGAGAAFAAGGAGPWSDVTISHNIATGNTGQQTIAYGFSLGSVTTSLGAENWVVSNNLIEDIQETNATAIALFNIKGLTISGNVIHHTNAGYNGRRGMNIDGNEDVVISNNTVFMGVTNPAFDNSDNSFTKASYPLQISASRGTTSNISITDNTLGGAYDGIVTLGNGDYTGISIENNTFHDVVLGIRFQAGTNTPTGSQQDILIQKNHISSSNRSIYLQDGSSGGGTPDPYTNVTITNNSLLRSTLGVALEIHASATVTDDPVNATCNWWGTTDETEVEARVSGDVTYVPFLLSNDLNNPVCTGGLPYVVSITRADASPTSALSVDFTVTFSEDVVDVDMDDFSLATTGVAGATITAVSGSGDTYTVSVSTGTGSGTIGLDIPEAATVENLLGNALINLPFTDGEVYVIDKGEVTIISIKRTGATPTSAASVDFIVTFSKDVTGVDVSDFVVSHISPVSTLSATSVTSVTGSGSLYTVTVNTGTGNGALRLDVPVTATINDLLANPLSGLPYTDGETYFLARLQTFDDVPTDFWAWAFIERLYAAGLTSGCSLDGLLYCPTRTELTRAEMAVFLLKGINGADYFPPVVTEFSFSDIEDHWAANWIEALKEAGLTSGYLDGTYKPNSPVRRAEMAVFLLKAINSNDYVAPPATPTFLDTEDHWAVDWIEALKKAGITSGYPDETYRPNNPVTRAEMSVFLIKAFELP